MNSSNPNKTTSEPETDPSQTGATKRRFLSLIKSRLNPVPSGTNLKNEGSSNDRVDAFALAKVSDVMIPRVDIQALDLDTSLAEAMSFFAECAHSRLPVYVETLDDPRGFVHIKSILKEVSAGSAHDSKPLPQLCHEALYVPPSMFAADLFLKMQASRIHLALVVDEFGGTDGLVTLKDLVEEIVGDIDDEHDSDAETLFTQIGTNLWEVDARMEVGELSDSIGIDIILPETENSVDTLGGIIFALAGRVPVRGEIIPHPAGIDMEVIEADSRRIRRVRLHTDADDKTDNQDKKELDGGSND